MPRAIQAGRANQKPKPLSVPVIPNPTDEFVKAVEDIAAGMRNVMNSRMKEKTLIYLIARDSGVDMGRVERVIQSLQELEKTYLKPRMGG